MSAGVIADAAQVRPPSLHDTTNHAPPHSENQIFIFLTFWFCIEADALQLYSDSISVSTLALVTIPQTIQATTCTVLHFQSFTFMCETLSQIWNSRTKKKMQSAALN